MTELRREAIDELKNRFLLVPAAKITQIREFTPAEWVKATGQVVVQAA